MRAFLAATIFCALLCTVAAPVQAAQRSAVDSSAPMHRGSIVTVPTAAGVSITVAAHLASRFRALIADFVAAGYQPRHIGCFARSGHVPNSRHYAGAACDFDQRGFGKTVPFMYRARAIITRHSFRDGCEFHDCGHVDDGVRTVRAVLCAQRGWDWR